MTPVAKELGPVGVAPTTATSRGENISDSDPLSVVMGVMVAPYYENGKSLG